MVGGAVTKGSPEEKTLISSILTRGSTPIGHGVYSKVYSSKPVAGHPGSSAANAWPALNHPLVIALARSSEPQEAMKEWMRTRWPARCCKLPNILELSVENAEIMENCP